MEYNKGFKIIRNEEIIKVRASKYFKKLGIFPEARKNEIVFVPVDAICIPTTLELVKLSPRDVKIAKTSAKTLQARLKRRKQRYDKLNNPEFQALMKQVSNNQDVQILEMGLEDDTGFSDEISRFATKFATGDDECTYLEEVPSDIDYMSELDEELQLSNVIETSKERNVTQNSAYIETYDDDDLDILVLTVPDGDTLPMPDSSGHDVTFFSNFNSFRDKNS